jgi:hypothetical protein
MRGVILAASVLAACGDDGGNTGVDAKPVPAMITITGQARAYTASGTEPRAGVTITAYRNDDETTVVAQATSDADGNYSITVETGGVALDGYFKGTLPDYMDTYLYPPWPVAMDFAGATIAMLTPDIFELLANTFCGANQPASGKAAVTAVVLDNELSSVAGATVGSAPAAAKYCYNEGGFPNRSATATAADGTAYFLNLPPGRVTVNAMLPGATYATHSVLARADVFTTTLFQPSP